MLSSPPSPRFLLNPYFTLRLFSAFFPPVLNKKKTYIINYENFSPSFLPPSHHFFFYRDYDFVDTWYHHRELIKGERHNCLLLRNQLLPLKVKKNKKKTQSVSFINRNRKKKKEKRKKKSLRVVLGQKKMHACDDDMHHTKTVK